MEKLIAMRFVCHGRVQGVFYRASTKEQAAKLNICGWVKNTVEGTVIIHAEGDQYNLEKLLNWCKKGPMMASVSKVEKQTAILENYKTFEVRYD